jgi:hypothetical protein
MTSINFIREFFKMIHQLKQYHEFTFNDNIALIMSVHNIFESSKFHIFFFDEIKLFMW